MEQNIVMKMHFEGKPISTIAQVLGESESIIRKEILRNISGTYWEPDYVMRQKKRDFNRKRREGNL